MAIFAGILIAYRMRCIRVVRPFYGFTLASATGFLRLMAADLQFSAFGSGNGLGISSCGLGVLFGVIGTSLDAARLRSELHTRAVRGGTG
jgi:uncharacterized YccA/Bax inhibitor family protein